MSSSDHHHRCAGAPLELAGEIEGTGHRQIPTFEDGLTAAADVDSEVIVVIVLDAIWVKVHHQGADLAAGNGADRSQERREGH